MTAKAYVKLIAILLIAIALQGITGCGDNSHTSLPSKIDFNFHIKPILSDRCYTCHGPDKGTRKGNLRLDTEQGALAMIDSTYQRYAIVPKNLKESSFSERISTFDPESIMPPPESNLKLSPYEIDLLNQWIKEGAEWKEHWAYISPEKPSTPKVKNKKWPITKVDYFTLASMEQKKMTPNDADSKEKWLRKVSFDLTGLPPSKEQLTTFLNDNTSSAYEKIVDQLLTSSAYGERMASVWLDAARYADSHGYQDDRPRIMWPWRDWVIDAFNQNMPYDSFTIYQLAGDLLPQPTYNQKLATGFNRNHPITQEGGVVNEEYVTEYVADRTNTTSAAFLGLTMECARCHDHKYDAISQKDYYSMFAFFNGLNEKGQIDYFDRAPLPNMQVVDEDLQATIDFIEKQISSLENINNTVPADEKFAYNKWLTSETTNEDIHLLLAQGLVGDYSFDETTDFETPSNIATADPGVMNTGLQAELNILKSVKGKKGKAFQFDGDNFLNIGDIGDYEWYHPFSAGAWIKSPSYGKNKSIILARRNEEIKRGGYELSLTAKGKMEVSLIYNQSKEKIVVQSKPKVTPSTWIHIFFTYDGSGKAAGISLFINGRKVDKGIIRDELERRTILTGNDMLVGNWTRRNLNRENFDGFANGKIDEVKLYNRQLSSIEVSAIANPQKTISRFNQQEQQECYLLNFSPSQIEVRNALYTSRKSYEPLPVVMIMEEMDTIRKTHILERGQYDSYGQEVFPSPPPAILSFSDTLPPNRLGLALWITDKSNPLTARVMVNRLWQLMLGRGLVATPEDFGNQGEIPSHPELLDYLATRFMDSGWDIKNIIKEIALSATYRQSGEISPEAYNIDPSNIWLARGPNERLSSEMIRDNALSISGLLHDSIGGKWVKPYQSPGIWKELANQIGENKYRQGSGNDLYRRSIYTYWKRTIPPPTMLTFDASERAVCVVKRQSTSTPLQSLVLLNGPQYIEASRALAMQMIDNATDATDEGLNYGFERVTSRSANKKEISVLSSLLEKHLASFEEEPYRAAAYLSIGELTVNKSYDTVQLAAWTQVANSLLNLDEAKMKS